MSAIVRWIRRSTARVKDSSLVHMQKVKYFSRFPFLTALRLPAPVSSPQDHASVGVMYMLGPDILKLMPSAYTVAQELERYKLGVLKVGIWLI